MLLYVIYFYSFLSLLLFLQMFMLLNYAEHKIVQTECKSINNPQKKILLSHQRKDVGWKKHIRCFLFWHVFQAMNVFQA